MHWWLMTRRYFLLQVTGRKSCWCFTQGFTWTFRTTFSTMRISSPSLCFITCSFSINLSVLLIWFISQWLFSLFQCSIILPLKDHLGAFLWSFSFCSFHLKVCLSQLLDQLLKIIFIVTFCPNFIFQHLIGLFRWLCS